MESSHRTLRIVIVLVAALALLATYVGVDGTVVRDPLPEDAPVLLGNDRLLSGGVLDTALDPAAAWSPAGEIVAEQRFRPLGVALFAVERRVGREGTLLLAGLVSAVLHLLVALGVIGLLRDLRASRGAVWIAGLLTALSPAALSTAAWPARQPLLLAAALGVLGVRLALRPATAARFVGGVVLALACLAHEAAFGVAAAAAVLVWATGRRADTASDARRTPGVALVAVLLPVAAVAAWRLALLAGSSGAPHGGSGPDLADGVVGMVTTLLAPLLPTHVHLAGGPWTAAPWARVACPVLVAAAALVLALRRRRPAAAFGLAAIVAATPVAAAAWSGGSPHHAGYVVTVLPFLACAVALALSAAARTGSTGRVGATAAAALLVGASVAGGLVLLPAFRDRAAFVETAGRADPDGVVVAAWRIGDAAAAAPDTGPERARALLETLPAARAVATRLVAPAAGGVPEAWALRRDAPAAVGVAAALAGYARRLARTPEADLPPGAVARLPELETIAEAATAVAPGWDGGWLVLARVRAVVGEVGGALEAAQRAAELAPAEAERLELIASLALQVGRTELAVGSMAEAAVLEEEAAAREGRRPRREHVLLRAEALAADALTSGLLVEFDWALDLLVPLYEAGDRGADLRALLYDIHLRWGDALVSLDRTAPALIAYERAVQLGGPDGEAAEHRRWLAERLRGELREAEAGLEQAAAGVGNVANALLDLAVVQCRVGAWDTADQMFAKIAEGQGGMNAALRFTRAVHRYAAREDQLDRAEEELRLVLEEDPVLVEARYRLAGVLLERGRVEEAAQEYRRASREGAAYEWAVDALERARRLESVLSRPAR